MQISQGVGCRGWWPRGIVASASNDTMVICEYARTGTFAETITEVLTKFFVPAGGTYIDIGANIGLMTIPLARNPLYPLHSNRA